MAKVLISEKYLYDIANAIRAKLDSQSSYTPAQMAAAIEDITGSIAGSITPSTVTSKKLVTDSYLTAIGNAIRAKLDVATLYTPAQMADAILSIAAPTPVVEIVSWANGTDEEVAAMIDAAHAGTIDLQQDGGWAVGDVRTISIASFVAGNETIPAQNATIVITSFNDYMNCGCLLQFDFYSSIDSARMNPTASTTGGYGSTEMKTATLPALVNAMPKWISDRLLNFDVLTSAGNKSTNIETVSNNKLAFRSEIEVFGACTYSASGEGSQLEYYKNESNRIKKNRYNANKTWWLRSPRIIALNSDFCRVNSDGTANYMNANDADYTYLAPFGCL